MLSKFLYKYAGKLHRISNCNVNALKQFSLKYEDSKKNLKCLNDVMEIRKSNMTLLYIITQKMNVLSRGFLKSNSNRMNTEKLFHKIMKTNIGQCNLKKSFRYNLLIKHKEAL